MYILPRENPTSGGRITRIVYYLSVVILATSMIDLFVNRLLFRAGPEVLTHMPFDAFYLALIGRVSLTLEQLLLFVALASATVILLRDGRNLFRVLGALLISIVACSALLYFSLPADLLWWISTLLVFSVALIIVGLGWFRVMGDRQLPTRKRVPITGFLTCLVLGFIFPLYYRMYLLVGAAGAASLPLPLEAYEAGIYFVMATMFGAFVHALSAPSPGFKLNSRNFAVAATLPTLLVVPMLYGVFSSFFLAQILAMVVAMSTDFVLSHDMLKAIVILSWFLLVAIFVLLIKGHYSRNKVLGQQGIGLILIMSTTFLFNYPYYLMLGTTGMLFLCYPLVSSLKNKAPLH